MLTKITSQRKISIHLLIYLNSLPQAKQALPSFEEDRIVETQVNPPNELSINHLWNLCDLFEGEEEPNLEEIQTAQHTHHTRSRGPVTQANPYVSNRGSTSSRNTQKKTMMDKAVTNDITISKNNPHVNKTTIVELHFNIVNELK